MKEVSAIRLEIKIHLKTQVNEKRGDFEAKFRPDGMNGNGVAGGKAQQNGSSHAGGAGADLVYISQLTVCILQSHLPFL